MSEKGEQEEQTHSTSDPQRSLVEWVTLSISVALLLLLAGILTHAQLTAQSATPLLEARADLEGVRQIDGAYHVPVQVQNRGTAGARDIQIRVSSQGGAAALASSNAEPAELRLDVLPPGASETATVVLRTDPARTPIEARVVSYLHD
jgi:uncharacterized protein (TIGR02588 family)